MSQKTPTISSPGRVPQSPTPASYKQSTSLTKTFPRFSSLPTELHLKIWRLSLLVPPRLLPLFYNVFTSTFILVRGLTPRQDHDWSLSSRSFKVSPILKSVPFSCTEAYSVFKSSITSLQHNITDSRTLTTPYNPSSDVVIFSQRVEPGIITAFVTMFPGPAAKTKRLAISCLKYPVPVLLELRGMIELEEVFVEWHRLSPSGRED